jgi:acetyl-CoA synthetase
MMDYNVDLDLWNQEAQNISWFKPWTQTLVWDAPKAHWFVNGQLNASYNCLDKNIQQGRGNHPAIVWESEVGTQRTLTYQELYDEVNRMAKVLKDLGVNKGDIVIIYMPMVPEAIAAMQAVNRIGATHAVVFSGFSAQALRDRIIDTGARTIITADVGSRRGKVVSLKSVVDEAINGLADIKKVLVTKRTDLKHSLPIKMEQSRDVWYQDVRSNQTVSVEPVAVESNHPLFILYTSGTTGKPKGIIHSTGGYLTYVYSTFKWAFGIKPEDVYWCTADIGWITGHSYNAYAPFLHGITMFMFEGAPDWPDAGIWWKLIEKYKVNIFYTAPTAIRMAMKAGEQWVNAHNLSSLRVLGSVGEPINPEAWNWYNKYIGHEHCPIIDTWWQTETGGFMIAPTAGKKLVPLKAGSATMPMPGIEAAVVDHEGKDVPANTRGYLVIKKVWPGMSIGIHNAPERFKKAYFEFIKDVFYSGDYAIKDTDGYFWLLGRADEVLHVAGHRIGTAELESAALNHKAVAEAAAIGIADEIRGEKIILFVSLKDGYQPAETLAEEIKQTVRKYIGGFVTPSAVHFIQKFPKTRSGKILRRVFKCVLENKPLGDTSTMEDEASAQEIKNYYETIKQAVTTEKNTDKSIKKEL